MAYKFEADNADTEWHVRQLSLSESLSDTYRCSVQLVHPDVNADVDGLLGVSAVVTMSRVSGVERRVCGIIQRVTRLGGVNSQVVVRAEIVPALWALSQSMTSRMFQEKKVPDILQEVLSSGLDPYQRSVKLDLTRQDYAEREYCAQYHETDLDFAQRLMQEEGIFFYFDHSGAAEEMVLVDSNDSLPECQSATGSVIDLIVADAGSPDKEVIHDLQSAKPLHSTGVVLREFDWRRPTQLVHQEALEQDSQGHERLVYDCEPALCLGPSANDGSTRKRLRKEQLDAEAHVCAGKGIVIGFGPGRSFELQGHSAPELDRKYAIVSVSHEGVVGDEWGSGAQEGVEYHNLFRCHPTDVPFRPRLSQKRPSMGMQTATVVGPSGEEIYTDDQGRVKVQFHWDRNGQSDEHSSCWMRVAQVWAGGGFGMLFVPRIGMEVVVQFLEGNPDKPLVTGCLYNGRNLPPITLPDDKTKSGLITRSSPNGNGGNELLFEDAVDREEINLKAQRDWKILVKNDQEETVRHNSVRTVEGNDDNTIEGDHTESVHGKDTVTVEKDRSVTVSGNYTESTSKNHDRTVDGDATLTIGKGYTVRVDKTANVQIGKDATLKVEGKRKVMVDGDSDTDLSKNMKLSVGKDAMVIVDKNLTVKVNSELVLQAEKSLTLKCGSASVTLKNNGKVQIKGGDVEVTGSGNVKVKGSKVAAN